MKNLTIVCATSNNNLKLAHELQVCWEKLGHQAHILKLEDYSLPLYTPALEESGIPEKAHDIAQRLINADAMAWIAPEYNGSIPPIVSNAVAWISRTDKEWRKAFSGKFTVVGTHSGGGGLKVCQAMRSQLEHLGAIILPRHLVTNYSKPLKPETAEQVLGQLLELTRPGVD